MNKRKLLNLSEKGMVMPVSLMFLAILAIVGTTTAVMTSSDLQFSGYDKTGKQALYVSEAGIEEARARLKADAVNPITDDQPAQAQWSTFTGSLEACESKGFQSILHTRVDSIQTELDYAARISHQTNASGQVLYWGDTDGDGDYERNTLSVGQNIYVINSTGVSTVSTRTIEAEVTRLPPVTVPAALYVEALTDILGNSTTVDGRDQCGGSDMPGIVTVLGVTTDDGDASVNTNGNPDILGAGGADPNITYNGTDMDVDAMVDALKPFADFSYTGENGRYTADSTPGPGDGWGEPTPGAAEEDATQCSEHNIVYYDTEETGLRLTGGVGGCGILLVKGDLEVHGGFSWHGMVITTGSVTFTGGGGNKNITGAVIAGGSTIADTDTVGGNANIIYCSTAISDQTQNRALKFLSFRDVLN